MLRFATAMRGTIGNVRGAETMRNPKIKFTFGGQINDVVQETTIEKSP